MKSPAHHPLKSILTPAGLTRLKSGHPWIYRTQIQESFPQPSGPALMALGEQWFFYSPRSEIRLRRFGPFPEAPKPEGSGQLIESPEEFAKAFGPALRRHFSELFRRKRALVGGESCFRWVFSEADLIPGLVVDTFENDLVAQIQAAPLEHFWPTFQKALLGAAECPTPQLIELRNQPVRKKEGLEVIEAPREVPGRWIRWNGFEWWMAPGGPQKTGAYLDQKENHLAAANWARRLGHKDAWDLCSFEGGFGIHLAAAGLKVLAVDQSETALAVAQKNLERNKLSTANFSTLQANIFDELRQRHQDRSRTDLIVLDPPSFVRSRADKDGAMRGLKELNLRALHCLKPGGLLVTCTCSHHIGDAELSEVMLEAAQDSRRRLKSLEKRGPSPDHAPLEGFAESRYLQAWFFEVL